jgi:hypothetical protein
MLVRSGWDTTGPTVVAKLGCKYVLTPEAGPPTLLNKKTDIETVSIRWSPARLKC